MGISLQDWKNVSLMLMKVSLQGLTRVEVNINTKYFQKNFFSRTHLQGKHLSVFWFIY